MRGLRLLPDRFMSIIGFHAYTVRMMYHTLRACLAILVYACEAPTPFEALSFIVNGNCKFEVVPDRLT